DAVAAAAHATERARALDAVHREHRHEARAALLGIEAAAHCLGQHRRGLSAAERAELSSGLMAEIRRLRSLVEDTARRPGTFDLRGAIMPGVACRRADGLAVRGELPARPGVGGGAGGTARGGLSRPAS